MKKKHAVNKGVACQVFESNPPPGQWEIGDMLEGSIAPIKSLNHPRLQAYTIKGLNHSTGSVWLAWMGYSQWVPLGDQTKGWRGLDWKVE